MKPYTKTYLTFFDYAETDFIPCECCGKRCSDTHHIIARSKEMKLLNDIINLMGLCRECHQKFGDITKFIIYLFIKHILFIKKHRPDYVIQYQKLPLGIRNDLQNHFIPKVAENDYKDLETTIASYDFNCMSTGIRVRKGDACLRDVNSGVLFSNELLKTII